MGDWDNTTYLRHVSVSDVAGCLAARFVEEGMTPDPAPAPQPHLGPMQYRGALGNDLWRVAVFPGADGWTVVKTAPLELLGERRAGADRIRLSELCRALSASAIQVNLYDSSALVLVEVSAEGEVLLSGYTYKGDDLTWNAERLREEDVEPRLRIHPLQGLQSRPGLSAHAAGLRARLGGENEAACDNLTSVDTLVRAKPLGVRGGVSLCFRWPGTSRVAP